jgi:hypothetical protein
MPLKLKSILALLPLLVTGFMPAEETELKVENYQNYRTLREASAPREVKAVQLDRELRKPVVRTGILVTYKNREARKVLIAGDFTAWKPQAMERSAHGVWYYMVAGPADTPANRYKFQVDGIWTNDRRNPSSEDDGMGSFVSILTPGERHEGKQLSYRMMGRNTVEFRLYSPHARLVSLVGDFNGWNPENDLLEKGRDGVWRLRKRLYRGTHRYTYIIDGRWNADLFNEKSASDDNGRICSLIRIE